MLPVREVLLLARGFSIATVIDGSLRWCGDSIVRVDFVLPYMRVNGFRLQLLVVLRCRPLRPCCVEEVGDQSRSPGNGRRNKVFCMHVCVSVFVCVCARVFV